MRIANADCRVPRAFLNALPCVLLAVALTLLAGCSATPPQQEMQTLSSPSRADYKTFDPVVQQHEGFSLYIDPKLLDEENKQEDAAAIAMLVNHLQRINILVPEPALSKLQQVGIWIELDHFDDVEPGPYHPGADWLKENGYDTRLAKKVHVTRAASLLERHHMLKHPMVILHELAHAYHDQFLGFDDKRVKAAFDSAMQAGLYQNVMDYKGNQVKAYATTNEMEYFAEATEAYFYRNDFYPFVGAELKQYDPKAYELMVQIWGPLQDR